MLETATYWRKAFFLKQIAGKVSKSKIRWPKNFSLFFKSCPNWKSRIPTTWSRRVKNHCLTNDLWCHSTPTSFVFKCLILDVICNLEEKGGGENLNEVCWQTDILVRYIQGLLWRSSLEKLKSSIMSSKMSFHNTSLKWLFYQSKPPISKTLFKFVHNKFNPDNRVLKGILNNLCIFFGFYYIILINWMNVTFL